MPTQAEQGVRATGACLCGGVRFEVRGALRAVVNCHCGQCRRTHGHFAAYTKCRRAALRLLSRRTLRWYRSSASARRGFCSRCGASLFWDAVGDEGIAVAAGCLDAPTGLDTVRHIHVASAGDYYTISDDLEQLAGSMAKADRP